MMCQPAPPLNASGFLSTVSTGPISPAAVAAEQRQLVADGLLDGGQLVTDVLQLAFAATAIEGHGDDGASLNTCHGRCGTIAGGTDDFIVFVGVTTDHAQMEVSRQEDSHRAIFVEFALEADERLACVLAWRIRR